MNKKYCRIALVIALVMVLGLIPGTLFAEGASAATAKPAVTAPKLTNHAASASSIKNTWNTVKNAKGYEVYRATKSNGKYKQVKHITDGKTHSWTDKKLKENKFYFYKVRAYGYVGGRKEYSDFSGIQTAVPTEQPNWDFSISDKSKKTKKLTLTLTNKSRYNMVFDAEGLYLDNASALKKWDKLGTGEWKELTKTELREKGMTYLKGKKKTIKPGKTATLTYKAGTTVKYTKIGRIMSEFDYNGGTYGVFHSSKYGSDKIWVY